MNAGRHVLVPANSVCLRTLSRYDWRELALLIVRVAGAVLFFRSKERRYMQEGSPTNIIFVVNYRLRRDKKWDNIPTMSPEAGEL